MIDEPSIDLYITVDGGGLGERYDEEGVSVVYFWWESVPKCPVYQIKP